LLALQASAAPRAAIVGSNPSRASMFEAIALHFMHYNFCRLHRTLRVTAAMEGGIADHIWTIEGMVGLLSENVQNAA
jgi:hypothetical protein